jgi:GNAT superfamily N-acetyltransferase
MNSKPSQASSVNRIINSAIELFMDFGSYPHCELIDDGNHLGLLSRVKHPMANSVVQAHLNPKTLTADIQNIIAPYQNKELPFLWYVWPNSSPENLGEQLLANGFLHSHDAPAMLADLSALPDKVSRADGLGIERVRTEEMLAEYRVPLEVSFEIPDEVSDLFVSIFRYLDLTDDASTYHYVAYLDGKLSACSTVYLGEDDVAGIWNVATLPEARGKGIGTAVTWEACCEAKQRGYQHAVLLSSEMGYNVYQRLGFVEIFKAHVYLWQPSENE